MQASAVPCIDEKVDFAERVAMRAQRQIGRDERQRRAVCEEIFEQAFRIAAEPHRAQPLERTMQRRGRRVERREPCFGGALLGRGRPWLRQRRAGRGAQQARTGEQPAEVADRDVAQRIDEGERRAPGHGAAGGGASGAGDAANVSRARHRSAHAFALSGRLRSRYAGWYVTITGTPS